MNSADCPPDTISPIGEKLGACAKPCIQEIFRPQNRGALAQATPATSRAQDDLRLLRFHNGFCLQSDWSAIDARRAGERKLTRLQVWGQTHWSSSRRTPGVPIMRATRSLASQHPISAKP